MMIVAENHVVITRVWLWNWVMNGEWCRDAGDMLKGERSEPCTAISVQFDNVNTAETSA